MATDSVPCPFRWVCFVLGLLQVFYAQYLCCPSQTRDFTISIASSFSHLDGRHWMRLLATLIKETNKLFLLGAVCKCLSPDSERSLTILLVFIVNRSTSIWYLLETFQSWLKQHFFCLLVPLALQALNPFKCESAHPLEPKLPVVMTGFRKDLFCRRNFFWKDITIVMF